MEQKLIYWPSRPRRRPREDNGRRLDPGQSDVRRVRYVDAQDAHQLGQGPEERDGGASDQPDGGGGRRGQRDIVSHGSMVRCGAAVVRLAVVGAVVAVGALRASKEERGGEQPRERPPVHAHDSQRQTRTQLWSDSPGKERAADAHYQVQVGRLWFSEPPGRHGEPYEECRHELGPGLP